VADEGRRSGYGNKGNVKGARLKGKSRRPLQSQVQRQIQRRPAKAGRYKVKGGLFRRWRAL